MVFVNRSVELASLRRLLQGGEARLGRLYGRRRLGKTELLRQAMQGVPHVYLTIPEQTRAGILRHLSDEMSRSSGRPLRYESLRDFLHDLPNHGARLVVLDEFQRLKEADRSAESILQEAWDGHLQRSGVVLILCGSVIGMMRRLGASTAPLFGRFAWDLELEPFSYGAVRLFYPEATEEERIARFGVFGATPHYHRLSRDLSLDEAIHAMLLDPGAPLREEPRLLLEMELRKPDRYLEILEALGLGARTLGEVAGRYGEPQSAYTPYAQKMKEELGLLRSDDPLGGKKKKSRLHFRDPFFHFYYRFVYPNLTRLDLGGAPAVAEEIRRDLDGYLGRPAFEEVARETLRAVNGTTYRGVHFDMRDLGAWWDGEEELDAVGVGARTAYACEAKFRRRPSGSSDVDALLRRAELFRRSNGAREVVPIHVSRGGFTDDTRARAEAGEFVAWTLDDVEAIHEAREPSGRRVPGVAPR